MSLTLSFVELNTTYCGSLGSTSKFFNWIHGQIQHDATLYRVTPMDCDASLLDQGIDLLNEDIQQVTTRGIGFHSQVLKLTELRDLLKEAQIQRLRAQTAPPLSTGRVTIVPVHPPGGVSHDRVERRIPGHEFTEESPDATHARYRKRGDWRGEAPINGSLHRFLPLNPRVIHFGEETDEYGSYVAVSVPEAELRRRGIIEPFKDTLNALLAVEAGLGFGKTITRNPEWEVDTSSGTPIWMVIFPLDMPKDENTLDDNTIRARARSYARKLSDELQNFPVIQSPSSVIADRPHRFRRRFIRTFVSDVAVPAPEQPVTEPRAIAQNTKAKEMLIKSGEVFKGYIKIFESVQQILADKLRNNSEYQNVFDASGELISALRGQEQIFGKENLTSQDFKDFKRVCSNAITEVRERFKEHRGWHKHSPEFRAIVGVLAAIPSVVVWICTLGNEGLFRQSWYDTFFAIPQTHSERELDILATNLEVLQNSLDVALGPFDGEKREMIRV